MKQFDGSTLASTEKAWLADIPKCQNIFPGHVEMVLDLAKSKNDYAIDKPYKQMAYGVFDKSPNIAQAVVDVIVTKQGKKVAKMLDCHIRPSILDKALVGSVSEVMEVAEAYIASVFGSLEVAGDNNLAQLKVYGRSQELLSVLVAVQTAIGKKRKSLKASIEGRWLVLNT